MTYQGGLLHGLNFKQFEKEEQCKIDSKFLEILEDSIHIWIGEILGMKASLNKPLVVHSYDIPKFSNVLLKILKGGQERVNLGMKEKMGQSPNNTNP